MPAAVKKAVRGKGKAVPTKRGLVPKKSTAASRRRDHRRRVDAGESSDSDVAARGANDVGGGKEAIAGPKPRAKKKVRRVVESENEE